MVPASPDAWCAALERWGTKTFAEVAAPAMECAEHGFPLSLFSAYQFGRAADKIRRYPTSAAIYLKDGQAPPAGHLLVETELAQTIKTMVTAELKARSRGRAGAIHAARDAFYKGDIAARIADFHAKEGGLLTRPRQQERDVRSRTLQREGDASPDVGGRAGRVRDGGVDAGRVYPFHFGVALPPPHQVGHPQ